MCYGELIQCYRVGFVFSPVGERIPVEELDENVVAMYLEDVKANFEEIFVPFKKLCKTSKVSSSSLQYRFCSCSACEEA
jgi:hypothetical protein